jgi:hypothetical protein
VANPIEFLGVKWKTTGNLCVIASSASEDATLSLGDCSTAPALSRWNIEFLDPTRIVLAGSQPCLAVAVSEPITGSMLKLSTCDKATMLPKFNADGRLGFGDGWHASIEGGRPVEGKHIAITALANLGDASRFYVSGRMRSRGRCATAPILPLVDIDWRVESRDCAAFPASPSDSSPDPLEWDYHW